MANLETMTEPELARYAAGTRAALEFTSTTEERQGLQRWLARLLLELDWRDRLKSAPRATGHSPADLVYAALVVS